LFRSPSSRNLPQILLEEIEMKRGSFARVVVQLDCHPEQAFFAQRGIWASRAMCRVLCDTQIARLARFLIKLNPHLRPDESDLGAIVKPAVPRQFGRACGRVDNLSPPHRQRSRLSPCWTTPLALVRVVARVHELGYALDPRLSAEGEETCRL